MDTTFISPMTPFQQGKAAFADGRTRFDNPYHAQLDEDVRAEWEAGFNYAVAQSIVQPEDNSYVGEVYTALLALAHSFEEQQYFSAAQELYEMAARGPEQRKGLDHFSTPDVLQVASERLAEIARMAQVAISLGS